MIQKIRSNHRDLINDKKLKAIDPLSLPWGKAAHTAVLGTWGECRRIESKERVDCLSLRFNSSDSGGRYNSQLLLASMNDIPQKGRLSRPRLTYDKEVTGRIEDCFSGEDLFNIQHYERE